MNVCIQGFRSRVPTRKLWVLGLAEKPSAKSIFVDSTSLPRLLGVTLRRLVM